MTLLTFIDFYVLLNFLSVFDCTLNIYILILILIPFQRSYT